MLGVDIVIADALELMARQATHHHFRFSPMKFIWKIVILTHGSIDCKYFDSKKYLDCK